MGFSVPDGLLTRRKFYNLRDTCCLYRFDAVDCSGSVTPSSRHSASIGVVCVPESLKQTGSPCLRTLAHCDGEGHRLAIAEDGHFHLGSGPRLPDEGENLVR